MDENDWVFDIKIYGKCLIHLQVPVLAYILYLLPQITVPKLEKRISLRAPKSIQGKPFEIFEGKHEISDPLQIRIQQTILQKIELQRPSRLEC